MMLGMFPGGGFWYNLEKPWVLGDLAGVVQSPQCLSTQAAAAVLLQVAPGQPLKGVTGSVLSTREWAKVVHARGPVAGVTVLSLRRLSFQPYGEEMGKGVHALLSGAGVTLLSL
jgi:hypothetical protein